MSLLGRRFEVLDPYYYSDAVFSTPFLFRETSVSAPKALAFPAFVEEQLDDFALSLDLSRPRPSLFDAFDDLIQIDEPLSFCTYRRRIFQRRAGTEVEALYDRVAALESRFERIVNGRRDGKYTVTAEVEGVEADRKFKWAAEIKGGKKKEEKWVAEIKKKGEGEKKYKWTAEIKGSDEADDARECSRSGKQKEKEKKDEKKESKLRIVEVEDVGVDHGAVVLREAFAKRSRSIENAKGKKKELSPQDAAMMIQMTFRAYLIRRSKALRALRELAVAKTKLKEIRALFNNFSYRRRVAQDAEERQRFSEKIIVLLLTVDAIAGADLMVRAAKRSMIDELEAMLDVVDPQPPGKSLSMRRRTFDMPDGIIRQDIAEGVTQVVQMLNGEGDSSSTFEACL